MYTTIQIKKTDLFRIKALIKELNHEKGGRHAAHEVIKDLLNLKENNIKKNGFSTVGADENPQI